MPARIPLSGNPKIGPEDNNIVLKFGGGLHTRASPDEIDPRESAGGQNFLIDIQNRNLRNRPPFDLIGTVPNSAQINGGATLLKSDGTVTTIFQAGNTVYKWDGATGFTSVGTVNPSCRLRGHWKTHAWNLSPEVVLITDLALADTVKAWDGTTLSTVVFTNEVGSSFGSFYAKYLNISNERAIFSNVIASTATPHMMVGCKTSNYNEITVNQSPSSALGADDPFFMLAPDLKPINGHLQTFLGTMISTEHGTIFGLTGSSAKDFAFQTFYAASGATGVESVEEIGNDFLYGRPGRIESVRDTNTYGNSESDDLTAIVSDQIATYNGWTNVFNSRTRKAYLFPTNVSEVWVMDCAIRDGGQISPWMRWRTSHPLAFRPTFVMSMLSPLDGLEYIFMGDGSGNIYRMEGTGANGDGGTSQIDVQFLTKLVSARLDELAYDVEGYVKYAQNLAATLTLTFQYQGETIFSQMVTVPLDQVSSGSYFGDSAYFGGSFYFGSFAGKIARRTFMAPGHANEFQLLVEVTGNNDISINEIGLRLRAASQ